MKILILTTVGRTPEGKYIDIFPSRWSTINDFKCMTFYPYGLAYLSSLLKEHLVRGRISKEVQVRMIDGNFKGWPAQPYAEAVAKENPDWVVLETCQLAYDINRSLITKLKELDLGIRVLLCGPYPTAYPERVLADGADAVALGEYEESILEFFQRMVSQKEGDPAQPILPPVSGIFPNPRRELLDIRKLPLPEDEDISRRDYCRMLACEYKEVEVFATRGCVNMCNFCVASNVYYGKPNFRTREVHRVIEEIKYLLARYPEVDGIFFDEENHVLKPAFNLELAEAIVHSGLDYLHYECMANFATLTGELLEKMKEAGYYKIRVGIETLDEDNSRQIFKTGSKMNKDRLYQVLEICRNIGLKVYGTLTMGSLGSTADTDRYSIDHIESLWRSGLLQEFQVSICTPMAGTPFHEYVTKEGLLAADSLENYDGNVSCVLNYPDYPAEKIEANFRAAHQLMKYVMEENQKKGIHYSMYDREWCRPVYEIG